MARAWARAIPFMLANLASFDAAAQTPPASPPPAASQAIQQQQQILQQQQQKEREEQRRKYQVSPPSSRQQGLDAAQKASKSSICVDIRSITITDAVLLPEDIVKQLNDEYSGRCLSVPVMTEVVRRITNWYIAAGYVTTRAYLPEQNIASGKFTIQVVEGRTTSVEIFENGVPRQRADTAFPDVPGTRLNIRDIEQGLDQIQRLQTVDAAIEIVPGDKPGDSRLVVKTARAFPIVVSTHTDNFGSPTTGQLQTGIDASVDDPLGLYDSLSVSLSHDTRQLFWNHDNLDELSKSASLFYSVPYGYWTANFSASYFKYATPIEGLNQRFVSSGNSLTLRGELERLVHRDQISKTSISAGVRVNETRNFIDDIFIGAQSRRLSAVYVRASHARSFLGGALSFSGTVERGLPLFGSENDDGKNPDEPRAEYNRLAGDARFTRPFEVLGQSFVWDTQVVGSWSPQELYSTERFSAGGRYTVRGFNGDSIVGDAGGYVRNELIWNLPSLQIDGVPQLSGTPQLFAAYDAGFIVSDPIDPFERGKVSGIAGGLRYVSSGLFGEAVYERALTSPDFIDRDDHLFHFRVGVSTSALN